MKKTIGILAHVDAGKTTFCEQLLWHVHALRTPGRVDHGNAFMDSHPLEKERGITIFADQACFSFAGDAYTLVDTPGHADFSAEMERALSVLDYAVLIISCIEGLQSHTRTVWKLLEQYGVPVFVFINKTDRAGADVSAVARAFRRDLSPDLVLLDGAFMMDGSLSEAAVEAVAERDEALLERLFSAGYDRDIWTGALRRLIKERRMFPALSGSALRGDGVDAFWHCLSTLTETDYHLRTEDPFQARVARIRFDAQGNRLAFLKIEHGSLAPRDSVQTPEGTSRINELRCYSGTKYHQAPLASAGDLIAATGLAGVKPGDIIGANARRTLFHTEPLMAVNVLYPPEIHPLKMLECLKRIEEEEPLLRVAWNERLQTIELQVLGEIQLEILRDLVRRQFGIAIGFGPCRIRYQETISAPVCGIGHYEPLRHYAEVHLKLEPAPNGSGISFASVCHVDDLALNWQRLIETHVFEYAHKGVLIGAPVTDVKITLLAGRAHIKHTEGGDFREATYRAIRNALMQAKSVLLEPVCQFEIIVPSEMLSRLTGDLSRMRASLDAPVFTGDTARLTGEMTFARISAYSSSFTAMTHGQGSLTWSLGRYAPCENAEEIVSQAAYNPLADDSPDSVFCAHGAGYVVHWNEVGKHAHLHTEANP